MTKLPANIQHAEALNYAQGSLRDVKDILMEMIGLEAIDKEESQRLALQILKRMALSDPDNLVRLVDEARAGWSLAQEALRQLLQEFLNRGEFPPTYLAAYQMDLNNGGSFPKIRGGKKETNILRDMVLAVVIWRVCEKFGFKATRNPTARRHPSACSIVAQASGIEESRLNALWGKWGAAF